MRERGRAAGLFLAIAIVVSTPALALAAETIIYNYDLRGRLVKVERSGSVNDGVKTEYKHDKADNRTSAKTTGSANPPP